MTQRTPETPRTARGTATRAKIVAVAAELMRARGVAATSLDSVLVASATSKSQLYHYFADKDALVLAVVQRQAECVLELHGGLLSNVVSLTGLRRWRDQVVESTRRTHCAGGCPLGSLVPELAETPESRAALVASFARWEGLFIERLAAVARGRRLAKATLDDLATTLMTALQGGLLLAQTTRSTRPLELALDGALELIERRLVKRPRAPSPRTHS